MIDTGKEGVMLMSKYQIARRLPTGFLVVESV